MRIAATCLGLTLLASCGKKAPRYEHTDPPFSLPLPDGYHAQEPVTDAAGVTTLTLSNGAPDREIKVMWRRAPAKDLLTTWRQVKQLELRPARLAGHEEQDGRVLLRFQRDADQWQERSAIVVGDWLIDCSVDGRGKPAGPDPRVACAGLSTAR